MIDLNVRTMGRSKNTRILNYMLNLISLCKKTPNTALFSFLNQSTTIRKLLEFKNFKSLVFDAFLSKT